MEAESWVSAASKIVIAVLAGVPIVIGTLGLVSGTRDP